MTAELIDAATDPISRAPCKSGFGIDQCLSPWQFAGLLIVLIAAAFPDLVSGANTFFFRDFGLFGYPLAQYHRESFWQGEVPLWNPYNDCGIPFLAQWNTMVLYPLSLFYVLFPLSWSLGIFCLVHWFWAGLGMYFLTYRWTGSRVGAGVAGIAFTFNGLSMNCLMWPNDIAALAWAPWVIQALDRATLQGGRAVFSAAVIGAMQMLTGGPEVILLTWVLSIGLAAADWISNSRVAARKDRLKPELPAGRVRVALRLGLVIVLVAGLAAAQLLPFLDLLFHSQRDALPNSAGWAMPAWGWANFFVPLFRMHPAYFGVYVQPGQHWTSSYYAGIGTLLLALWGAVFIRTWRARALGVAAIFGTLLSLGNNGFLYPAIKLVLPQIGALRYPIKAIVLTTLAVPPLAGLAAAHWASRKDEARRCPPRALLWVGAGAGACIVAILVWARVDGLSADQWSALAKNAWERLGVLGLVVGVLLAARRVSRPQAAARLWAGLLVLLCIDGLTHAPRQNPTAPRWVYEAGIVDEALPRDPRPRLGQTRAMVSPQADFELAYSHLPDPTKHHLSRRATLFNNLNLVERIPKVDGMFSLYPKHEAEVMTVIYAATNTYPASLVDFLGVSQVSSNLFGWAHRSSSMPLLTGGQRPAFADHDHTLVSIAAPEFEPRTTVYLPQQLEPALHQLVSASVTIQPVSFSAGKIAFTAASQDPALVVIAQTFYHWWHCQVDGKAVPIWRANHAFQAVALPPGQHRIELRYRDLGFLFGCAISGLTVLLCGAGWLVTGRQGSLGGAA